MKHLFISIFVLLTSFQLCFPQTFVPVDFEGGGFVTEVYRIDIGNDKMLFARTDIGGVYSSVYDDNKEKWSDWTFLNTFAFTMAGLHVQGFLANDDYYYVCCGTDYLSGAEDEGLWRYDVSSEEWSSTPILEINYGGNVPHSKIGGECIVQDGDVLYTGGRTHSGSSNSRSTVYRSTDDGDNWTDINPSTGEVEGHVSTIVVNPNDENEVWIGTDEGVWKGVYDEDEFEWTNKIYADPPDEDYYKLPYLSKNCMENLILDGDYNTPVHRIVMTQDGQYIFVTMGYEIRRSTDYGATFSDENNYDITEGFYDGEDPNILSAVNLFDNDQYLLVSVIDKPTKITDDFTEPNPEDIDWGVHIDCSIDENSYTPKHSCSYWNDHISWSRTNFTLGASPDEWYSSGPYNLYRSLDDDFATTDWIYMVVDQTNYTHGINFPVVYDVTFGNGDTVYIPIADLVAARFDWNSIGANNERIEIIDYARQKFIPVQEEMCDTYISNATRVLTSKADDDVIYLVGGNIFVSSGDYTGSILKSTNKGISFEKINTFDPGYCIIDGLIPKDPEDLVVLVGGGEKIERVGTDRGVYWSTNSGTNFTRSTGISSNAYVDEIFGHQTNLVQDPNDPEIIYLYLEGGDASSYDEQFYKSTDEGHSWTIITTSFPGVEDYYNKGCLAATDDNGNTILYLAMWGDGNSNSGFFKSTNQGVTWTAFDNWESSEQVVANGDVLYVFGTYTYYNDDYNKIWYSTDGGSTFSSITDNGYSFPSTSHLTIDPNGSDVLWISTSGQGVFKYNPSIEEDILVDVIKTNTPFSYSLEQNYPNPFNPISTINYSIAYDGLVNITVYDLLGREVQILVNEYKTAGKYEVEFNKSNYASGVYFYKLESGDFSDTKKMVLIK